MAVGPTVVAVSSRVAPEPRPIGDPGGEHPDRLSLRSSRSPRMPRIFPSTFGGSHDFGAARSRSTRILATKRETKEAATP